MSRWITFDLETVGDRATLPFFDRPKAPANYKDQAKIDAYEAEKLAEQEARLALSADTCRIAAAGWTQSGDNDEQPVVTVCRTEAEEAAMLRLLVPKLGLGVQILGFNCLQFDLPVLLRRCQLLGVDEPPVELHKYRPGRVLDLMQILTFNGIIPPRSLKFYAKRFGIPVTDTLAGRDIEGLVAAGEWDLVASHCRHDVATTVALARRLGLIAPVGEMEDASIPF